MPPMICHARDNMVHAVLAWPLLALGTIMLGVSLHARSKVVLS